MGGWTTAEPRPALDIELLRGFRFGCLPGCGLCCYATPAADPEEQRALLALDPELPWRRGRGELQLIPSRPDGGACRFLTMNRCRVHEVRPFPCREYPITVHLGTRAQATVVLSCPGVDLTTLADPGLGSTVRAEPVGLDGELSAARRALSTAPDPQLRAADATWRRRARQAGLRESDRELADLRLRLADPLPEPGEEDVEALDLPRASRGLDRLPMYFDPRHGRVALAGLGGGVELLALAEEGGVREHLSSLRRPGRLPRTDEAGGRLLQGYLRYTLRRDAFVGVSLLQAAEDPEFPLEELLADDLRALAATVLVRGAWRAQLAGSEGARLDSAAVADGIRATDADFLDRASAGQLL